MAELDLLYLCRTIGNLAGVPIRLYRGRERVFFFSQSYLPCDPVSECIERIMDVSENVGYVMTECFHCYGIVNSSDGRIVIGPTRQIEESEQELRDLAFRLDGGEALGEVFGGDFADGVIVDDDQAFGGLLAPNGAEGEVVGFLVLRTLVVLIAIGSEDGSSADPDR